MTVPLHTGTLESYHSLLLKYCPKRLHFSYEGMYARTELAILDNNNNTNREQKLTVEGEPICRQQFLKRTKRWNVKPVMIEKNYAWKFQLMNDVLAYLDGSYSKTLYSYEKPELPRNIATVPAPSKESLIEAHKSRFNMS